MVPNHYMKSCCLTKHPFKTGWLSGSRYQLYPKQQLRSCWLEFQYTYVYILYILCTGSMGSNCIFPANFIEIWSSEFTSDYKKLVQVSERVAEEYLECGHLLIGIWQVKNRCFRGIGVIQLPRFIGINDHFPNKDWESNPVEWINKQLASWWPSKPVPGESI